MEDNTMHESTVLSLSYSIWYYVVIYEVGFTKYCCENPQSRLFLYC